jgi:hypothetical protein
MAPEYRSLTRIERPQAIIAGVGRVEPGDIDEIAVQRLEKRPASAPQCARRLPANWQRLGIFFSRADAPNPIAHRREDRATFRIFTRAYSNSGLLLRLRFKLLHHTFDCAEGLGADAKGRHLGDWAMALYWSWFTTEEIWFLFFSCWDFYMLPISAGSPSPRCEQHCFYIHRSLVVIVSPCVAGRSPIPNLSSHLSDLGLRPSHLAELAPSSNAQTRVH